jgi:hypothetical protein
LIDNLFLHCKQTPHHCHLRNVNTLSAQTYRGLCSLRTLALSHMALITDDGCSLLLQVIVITIFTLIVFMTVTFMITTIIMVTVSSSCNISTHLLTLRRSLSLIYNHLLWRIATAYRTSRCHVQLSAGPLLDAAGMHSCFCRHYQFSCCVFQRCIFIMTMMMMMIAIITSTTTDTSFSSFYVQISAHDQHTFHPSKRFVTGNHPSDHNAQPLTMQIHQIHLQTHQIHLFFHAFARNCTLTE